MSLFKIRLILLIPLISFFLSDSSLLFGQQNNTQRDLGLEYFRNREYDKALPVFEQLYESQPSHFHYHYYIFCLLEEKDFKKAERIARRQIKANPNDLRYEVDLGFVFMNSGDVNKGKKQYDDVIKNLRADRNAINNVANAFISRRENEYAIKTYLTGRELLGNSYGFHSELANLYDRLGDFENMIAEYMSLIRTDNASLSQIQTRIQNALATDTEGKRAQFLRTSLLRNIRQYPDVLVYSEMMLWYAIQQKDFEAAYNQATALDRRLNENGNRVYALAQLSLANQAFDIAVRAYEYLISRGEDNPYFFNSRIEVLNAHYRQLSAAYPVEREKFLQLEQRYYSTLNELGRNRLTVNLMRDLANLNAFRLYDTEKATSLLYEAIEMPGIRALTRSECKLDLADILLYTGDVWDAMLLYAQVEKEFPHEPIGHEAKFRNARLCFYIGEFEWARAQLNVLKGATSKLIANDAMALSLLIKDNMDIDSTYNALAFFARADLHSYRNRDDLALQTLDSLEKKFPYHPILDDVLFKRAEISIRKMDYGIAGEYLQQIVNTYSDGLLADKAMFRLAEVYEVYLNDAEKAMEYYKELLIRYPASLQAAPARQRFRTLRGDVI
jgi:tetratricopeptide (TPR) repeat protein